MLVGSLRPKSWKPICYELDEPNSYHFFLADSNMGERDRTKPIKFLKSNIEFFARTSYKMLEIDLSIIKHEFNVMPDACPIKQP